MVFATHEDLVKNHIELEAFEYQGLSKDLVELYSSYEIKFKKLFEEYASMHNLRNCHFFIKKSDYCNALAGTKNGFNVIGITNGYPISMKRKFSKDFFEKTLFAALLNDQPISDAYVKLLYKPPEFNISEFMLNCSITFTFHHEFRHILQFNHSRLKKNSIYHENLVRGDFNIRKHAREFDADRMAAFAVMKYALKTYKTMSDRKTEQLKCMFYLGLSSIIITKNLFYFNIMSNTTFVNKIVPQPFYTGENSHPHPITRIDNIFNYFIEFIRDGFSSIGFEADEVLINVLAINKYYFDSIDKDSDAMSILVGDWNKFQSRIDAYNNKLYNVTIRDKAIRRLLIKSGTNFEE